jgi:hypothetical protein
VRPDRIVIFCREKPGSEMRSKSFERKADQIVGQGVNQFIIDNIRELANGKILQAKLVLPAQMDQFDVSIRKHKRVGNRLIVRLELDNWLLKLFTPHVEIEYDMIGKRLLRYDGMSMIADVSGKCKPVSVSYRYPEGGPMVSSNL